jgi:hypothetical protein
MEADRELILEDARSISEKLWLMARYAQDAAESLEATIATETLDGQTEAEELQGTLERVQTLGLEISEEIDAYQNKHSP